MSDLKLNFDKSWINIFNKYEIISKVKKNGYMDITAGMHSKTRFYQA